MPLSCMSTGRTLSDVIGLSRSRCGCGSRATPLENHRMKPELGEEGLMGSLSL